MGLALAMTKTDIVFRGTGNFRINITQKTKNMKANRMLSGKKILFVLCGFELGGAERQALHLARHLKGLGCEVRVWGHHHKNVGPERVIKICEEAGIPWDEYRFRWPCGKIVFIRDLWKMLLGLRKERPDIILPYLPWPSTACGLLWRLSSARICIWGQRNVDDLHVGFVQRSAYRSVSGVICNAEHEVEYLRRTIGGTKAPVHVVHNGVDLGRPQRSRSEWRKELGIEQNAVVATMVANFRPQKDHPTLLHAWRKVTDNIPNGKPVPYLILAGAPLESFDDIFQLASSLNLNDSVIFPGQIEDVSGLLAASDIGILTTRNEGLPNAILENMYSGLPVVATDVSGNIEALGEKNDKQLCSPRDSVDLAQKISFLVENPAVRAQLGERNQKRALSEFSIEVMCKRMVRVITDIYNQAL